MIHTFLFHVALAILLFYVVNWIGGHSANYGYLQLSLFVQADQAPAFNFILKTFAPTVFVILASTSCYLLRLPALVPHIWLVAAYYFAFRILFNLFLQRGLLLDWRALVIQTAMGTGSAYLAYRQLILPRRPLFPDAQYVGNELWILVALFLYATFNNIRTSDAASSRRKNTYLRHRYNSFKDRYADLIEDHFPNRYMELVAYSVLAYESFNRPWIARAVERLVFPWGSQTLGPMQVHTTTRLSDRESVQV